MKDPRPSELVPEFRASPQIDTEYARRYPYAGLALAVARLRAEHDLTQAEFAARLGTSQSVVARLESGRHGIQVSLLNRIAGAFGVSWSVGFGPHDEPIRPASVATSDDPILDAFNAANTAGDLDTAHRIARRIRMDPSSPRRRLAVAIDDFNGGDYDKALKGSRAALAVGLIEYSATVARIVSARSLLGLARFAEAAEEAADLENELGIATRVEAMIALDHADDAVAAAELLLRTAGERFLPLAAYLAARAYWHANRPLRALNHITVFRVAEPRDLVGAMLHGAILGHLGDANDDVESYQLAMEIFQALPDDHIETWRLRAMTAARLGDWSEALSDLARTFAGTRRSAVERKAAKQVVDDCLDRITDADSLDRAIELARSHGLLVGLDLRRRQSSACAMRGDFEGAVKALQMTVSDLERADPHDQVRCASALLVGNQAGRAYEILLRNRAILAVPDGQVFLAKAALARGEVTLAVEALELIAGDENAAAVTRVALDLLQAIRRSHEDIQVLQRLSQTRELTPQPTKVLRGSPIGTASTSSWEGPDSLTADAHHVDAIGLTNRLGFTSAAAQVH
jgi:transcriptional regulator with XRE-family HTH domain